MATTVHMDHTEEIIALEERFGAHNYHPLDRVITRGEGAWLYDIEERKYLDCLSAYSAVNQGHCHPRLVEALVEQAHRVTLTSRAFRNDQLAPFCEELANLCGMEAVLPMNTGAEAVETAIKAARRWGYQRKGIRAERAEILVFENNFHGRTTTIVGFSSEPAYRRDFGPFAAGFTLLPFGDIEAVRRAMNPNVCAVLVEPIQCEAGIIIPPQGFLRALNEVCIENDVLLIADEIQTGLGRTGRMFACDHDRVKPDIYVLGKALSGGMYPVSAIVSRHEIIDLFEPGSHGSTYGGNPLACAVARAAIGVIQDEQLAHRSATLGARLLSQLSSIRHPDLKDVRGRGLLIGLELRVPARPYCEALMERGVLCKETHDKVIRLAPPLVVEARDLDWMVEQVRGVFARAG